MKPEDENLSHLKGVTGSRELVWEHNFSENVFKIPRKFLRNYILFAYYLSKFKKYWSDFIEDKLKEIIDTWKEKRRFEKRFVFVEDIFAPILKIGDPRLLTQDSECYIKIPKKYWRTYILIEIYKDKLNKKWQEFVSIVEEYRRIRANKKLFKPIFVFVEDDCTLTKRIEGSKELVREDNFSIFLLKIPREFQRHHILFVRYKRKSRIFLANFPHRLRQILLFETKYKIGSAWFNIFSSLEEANLLADFNYPLEEIDDVDSLRYYENLLKDFRVAIAENFVTSNTDLNEEESDLDEFTSISSFFYTSWDRSYIDILMQALYYLRKIDTENYFGNKAMFLFINEAEKIANYKNRLEKETDENKIAILNELISKRIKRINKLQAFLYLVSLKENQYLRIGTFPIIEPLPNIEEKETERKLNISTLDLACIVLLAALILLLFFGSVFS